MPAMSVTRGHGVLEGFLARRRTRMANRLIPPASRNGRLLDIGCGTTPFFLMNTEFAERVGIDKVVGSNGHFDAPPGIDLRSHDLGASDRLPFDDDAFDIVTMLAVFEHIEPPILRQTLREIRRVLRPGGLYVLTTPAGWADGILRTMARIGLVSSEEIDEHQDRYDHRKIAALLADGGFDREAMRFGSFELGMNLWATARK